MIGVGPQHPIERVVGERRRAGPVRRRALRAPRARVPGRGARHTEQGGCSLLGVRAARRGQSRSVDSGTGTAAAASTACRLGSTASPSRPTAPAAGRSSPAPRAPRGRHPPARRRQPNRGKRGDSYVGVGSRTSTTSGARSSATGAASAWAAMVRSPASVERARVSISACSAAASSSPSAASRTSAGTRTSGRASAASRASSVRSAGSSDPASRSSPSLTSRPSSLATRRWSAADDSPSLRSTSTSESRRRRKAATIDLA